MERFKCLECGVELNFKKTLGRHIRDVHHLEYIDYLTKHGQSELRTCHCGKTFANTRYPGGPRAYGRAQIHCSPRCVQIATQCRYYGITTARYWELQSKGCSICGQMETQSKRTQLSIDHDHETGEVRGLLCSACNSYRVGKNTLETAIKVVEYLSKGGECERFKPGQQVESERTT